MKSTFLGLSWRRWLLYGLLGAVWTLALLRVLTDHRPYLPLLFNVSHSLPYVVARIDYHKQHAERGDFVIYAFHGEACNTFPGLRGQPFFKRVGGVAGDRITVTERRVRVNGVAMGQAKRHTTLHHIPLEPIAEMVIPPGFYYMYGTSDDSFDSRYRISGLVPAADIIAIVRPIF